MARPPNAQQAIDAKELEDLMKFYPSIEEVGDWFGVSESSLKRFIKKHFNTSFEHLRDKSFVRTKIAIKRAQIKKALTGDNTMLIWVGKQYLAQKETQKHEVTGADGGELTITKIERVIVEK